MLVLVECVRVLTNMSKGYANFGHIAWYVVIAYLLKVFLDGKMGF